MQEIYIRYKIDGRSYAQIAENSEQQDKIVQKLALNKIAVHRVMPRLNIGRIA
jgi:hypothetical protein